MDIYVSKLGDNSTGADWRTAFRTIQQGLLAVPDACGGHRVIVRPDTYLEANLYTARQGVKGAYNELVGDFDGRLGSGTTGWVVIDSGDPARGFKSYDWWSTIRAYSQGWSKEHTGETFSSTCWDRWALRRLYATGSDAGLFFDGTVQVRPFSVLVEDCVSIGRAFGGGVASVLSRADEPITFRRCHLWALDYIGDTAAAYLRVENTSMPAQPDVILEDCVMTAPQACVKSTNYGFFSYTWTRLTRCRLIQINFSQPEMTGTRPGQGQPPAGIVTSVQRGDRMKVSFEDCLLMGYRMFGVMVEQETARDIQFETKGNCQAYLQFKQELPPGFHRLGHWPVEAFQQMLPPAPVRPTPFHRRELVKRDLMEVSPVLWQGRLCRLECDRPASGGKPEDYHLRLVEEESGAELACFGEGHSLGSAIVHDGVLHVFASRFAGDGWNDVTLFRSADLRRWDSRVVIRQQADEHLFNSSVCRGASGFVMAYESNDPAYPPFTIKFATSPDLENWTPSPEPVFGADRYTACPCLRHVNGWYYLMYLEQRVPEHYFHTFLARSKDLRDWELSPANPVLSPEGLDEGVNASDPEIIEVGGQTHVYFAVSDQLTWANLKCAVYPGPMREFFERWFPADDAPVRP